MAYAIFKSWRTTALGLLIILDVVFHAIAKTIDMDPTTVVDWNVVFLAIASGVGLIFAKDAKAQTK